MADFKEYTMSGGTVGPVDEAQLDALVGRYEWFTPARILRVLQTGRSDRRVSIWSNPGRKIMHRGSVPAIGRRFVRFRLPT